MREMRRKDREMPEEFAWEQVDQAPYGVLAMVDPEGAPYCVALDMAREGRNIYFHSAMAGTKVECLHNNNKVTVFFVGSHRLAPEDFTHRYATAVVHGIAEEVTDLEEKTRIMRDVMVPKLAPSNPRAKTRDYAACTQGTGIWKIVVEEIHGKANQDPQQ